MSTTLGFKDVIDIPDWRVLSPSQTIHGAGSSVCSDLRNNEDRIPAVYYMVTTSIFYAYQYKNDGWLTLSNPAMHSVGAGSACVVTPSRGPRGTIAAGASTTSFTLSTALPAAVGVNQLANRCDGVGYKVRIIDTVAGKTEERYIIANTGGTAPVVTVGVAFSFVPATGATYEFLSGRVYLLSNGTGVDIWRAYDVLTNSMFANLSVTNLPTIVTDSTLVSLDELHVPAANQPGEGFLLGTGDGGVASHALTATASSATTLTGQAAGGDSGVATNEYRNFQLRIVKDTVTPTSVGQRRKITSHTAGVSPVYTVPTWTVTPSTSAQYVIENANEVLLFTSAVATVYTYTADVIGSASADSWSTTTYGVRANVTGGGVCAWHPFGMTLDAGKNARWSFVYSIRGGGTTAIDLLDIAGGANGAWTQAPTYGGSAQTYNTGTCACVDPFTGYAYINANGSPQVYRFDSKNRVLEGWSALRYTQAGLTGGRMSMATFIDGSTKFAMPTIVRDTDRDLFQTLATR